MTGKSEELKPCPFCGGQAEIVKRDVEPQGDPWYGKQIAIFVLCKCGACLFDEDFHYGFEDKELAIEYWNTRPHPPAAKELRDKFENELKTLQDSCPHEITEVMPYMWALGHYGNDVEVCKNCEKIIKNVGEP